jgi:hypothetical protein
VRSWERFTAVVESTALLGPVNLVAFVVATAVSAAMFGYRLLTQGYCRCFFSSK